MCSKMSGKQTSDNKTMERQTELRVYCLQPECQARNYYSAIEDCKEHAFAHLSQEDREIFAAGKCKDCEQLFCSTIACIGHRLSTSHKVVPFERPEEGGVLVVTPKVEAALDRFEAMKINVRLEEVEVDSVNFPSQPVAPSGTLNKSDHAQQSGGTALPSGRAPKRGKSKGSTAQVRQSRKEHPLVVTPEMAAAYGKFVNLMKTSITIVKDDDTEESVEQTPVEEPSGTVSMNNCGSCNQHRNPDDAALLAGQKVQSSSGGATLHLRRENGMPGVAQIQPSGSQPSQVPSQPGTNFIRNFLDKKRREGPKGKPEGSE